MMGKVSISTDRSLGRRAGAQSASHVFDSGDYRVAHGAAHGGGGGGLANEACPKRNGKADGGIAAAVAILQCGPNSSPRPPRSVRPSWTPEMPSGRTSSPTVHTGKCPPSLVDGHSVTPSLALGNTDSPESRLESFTELGWHSRSSDPHRPTDDRAQSPLKL